jgi:CRP-like cAMP-binding protein
LKGLSSNELEHVFAAAKAKHLPAKKVIVRQDDHADQFFLLTTGHARYFFITKDGRKIILFGLVPGDVFGGAAILSEPRWYLLGTETVKESQVLVWESSVIKALTAKYPRLMQNALLISYEYLGWYLATHVGLTCHTASQRFASVLVTLAHAVGQKGPSGTEIETTNEELANAAAFTTFTASRLLSGWQRSGVILKERGKLVICSPERLLTQKEPTNYERQSDRRRPA